MHKYMSNMMRSSIISSLSDLRAHYLAVLKVFTHISYH